MSKYISVLQKAMDGRSLKSETMKRVFDPTYKIGSNKTIDALKYLQELPSMVGENMAVSFIEVVANHRAVGWKALANVIDLVDRHCDNPSEVINEIITAMANRRIATLDDGSMANKGGDIIASILFKHTGKSINEGQYCSSRSDAMVERQKTIIQIKIQIKNRLKRMDPNSRDALLLRDVLGIETKSIVPLMHLVQVLTDETQPS